MEDKLIDDIIGVVLDETEIYNACPSCYERDIYPYLEGKNKERVVKALKGILMKENEKIQHKFKELMEGEI